MGRPWLHVLDRGRDHRVPDDADAVRVGDGDGSGQLPGFADPLEAGQLAVAVQAMTPGEDGFVPVVRSARHDDRHPGPYRTAADHERPVALDDRGVPDPHAGHIRDGVEGSRAAEPDGDPEVSRPHRWMLAG